MVTVKADETGSSSLGLWPCVVWPHVFTAGDMGDPPTVFTLVETGRDGEAFFHRFLDFFLADLNADDGAYPHSSHCAKQTSLWAATKISPATQQLQSPSFQI